MSAPLRVVSLLPSATEIAVAVGLGEQLLGRSHECDFPRFVGDLPVLTSTKLEKGLTSLEIDVRVQEIVRQGLSVYAVDTERLRAIRPDVILTQSQCAVCAVTPADLVDALDQWTGTQPVLVSLAPDDLSDVWGDFARVGQATGREAEAAAALAGKSRSGVRPVAQGFAGTGRPLRRKRSISCAACCSSARMMLAKGLSARWRRMISA